MKFLTYTTQFLTSSALALGLAACSSDSGGSNPQGQNDAGTGGSSTGGAASTGGGTSTGGAASTGGSMSTGGSASTGGSTSSNPCDQYCSLEAAKCTGTNDQYPGNDCATVCPTFATTGQTGDFNGNTLQCRLSHLGAIASPADADTHCQHTGVTPTAFCL